MFSLQAKQGRIFTKTFFFKVPVSENSALIFEQIRSHRFNMYLYNSLPPLFFSERNRLLLALPVI